MGTTIAIVGAAGTMGSALAFRVAIDRLVDEIVLIDPKDNVLRAHQMDLEQAATFDGDTRIRVGANCDLAGCQIVVVTASVAASNSTDRRQFLGANVGIVRNVAHDIAHYCPDAVVIVATNPVDICNYVVAYSAGLDASKCIGLSFNDSIRFRWAAARILDVPARTVGGLVVGEHGPRQVPLFSTLTVNGRRIDISAAQRREIELITSSWFQKYTSLQSGRTSGWTSAVSLARTIGCLLGGSSEIQAASVIPRGEYGLEGLSIGLPVRLGAAGVESVVELNLEAGEREALAGVSVCIRDDISMQLRNVLISEDAHEDLAGQP